MKLSLFFKEKEREGPWAAGKLWTAKCDEFKAAVKAAQETYETDQQKAMGSSGVTAQLALETLKADSKKGKSEGMEAARAAASKKLAKKKEVSTCKLSPNKGQDKKA